MANNSKILKELKNIIIAKVIISGLILTYIFYTVTIYLAGSTNLKYMTMDLDQLPARQIHVATRITV